MLFRPCAGHVVYRAVRHVEHPVCGDLKGISTTLLAGLDGNGVRGLGSRVFSWGVQCLGAC